MTEWERLQKGLIYNDFDEDLFLRRVAAKKLFKTYNKTDDDEVALRNQILQQLFKRTAKMFGLNPISDVSSAKTSPLKTMYTSISAVSS